MNVDTLLTLAGLALNAVVFIVALNRTSVANNVRIAVLETKLEAVQKALEDIKQGAGLARRGSDQCL